jgi:uncharacterized protein (TIGR02145 family)
MNNLIRQAHQVKNYIILTLFFLSLILIIFITSCIKGLPDVTTSNVTEITASSAKSGGIVTDNGGSEVTERGVCWGTDQNPETDLSKTSDGIGNGAFTSTINGLSANTKYYVRAYAANSEGISYGNEVSFTTNELPLPKLSTVAINSISTVTARSGGNITNDGGSAITAKGVCWSETQNPTVSSDNKTNDGSGTGSYTSNLTGLKPGTKYYLRAYATNSGGTAYGDQVTFVSYIADNEGFIYPTIEIGSQIWMKTNLKSTNFKNGSNIPLVTVNATWGSLSSPAMCWYKNDAVTYNGTYGVLYNWYAVGTGNLCPDGWHVPSNSEWTTLIDFLGGPAVAGGKMKESGFNHWVTPNLGATNESGFTGLPGAYRYENGGFYETIGEYGFFWASTEISSTNAWDRGLRYETGEIRAGEGFKKVGMSVRCLKN